MLNRMERADGDAVVEVGRGFTPEGNRQQVDPVVDRGVEGSHDISIEALVASDRRPADLVGGDPSSRGSALGGSLAVAEDARAGDEVAAGGGEGVGPVALIVAGSVKCSIEWAHHGGVALVEVPSSDQLPVLMRRKQKKKKGIKSKFPFGVKLHYTPRNFTADRLPSLQVGY